MWDQSLELCANLESPSISRRNSIDPRRNDTLSPKRTAPFCLSVPQGSVKCLDATPRTPRQAMRLPYKGRREEKRRTRNLEDSSLIQPVDLYQGVAGGVLKSSHNRGVASGRERPGDRRFQVVCRR